MILDAYVIGGMRLSNAEMFRQHRNGYHGIWANLLFRVLLFFSLSVGSPRDVYFLA